ncbi:uncharacterized protein [Oryctolagus cuniculus]|uniref:uncharacterized protein n=1 Tax=Oryctolagus cuniculus TaxID=9986 RepID=UPI00387978F4
MKWTAVRTDVTYLSASRVEMHLPIPPFLVPRRLVRGCTSERACALVAPRPGAAEVRAVFRAGAIAPHVLAGVFCCTPSIPGSLRAQHPAGPAASPSAAVAGSEATPTRRGLCLPLTLRLAAPACPGARRRAPRQFPRQVRRPGRGVDAGARAAGGSGTRLWVRCPASRRPDPGCGGSDRSLPASRRPAGPVRCFPPTFRHAFCSGGAWQARGRRRKAAGLPSSIFSSSPGPTLASWRECPLAGLPGQPCGGSRGRAGLVAPSKEPGAAGRWLSLAAPTPHAHSPQAPAVPLPAGCPTVPAAGSKGVAEFSYFLFGAKAQDIFSIGGALTSDLHKDCGLRKPLDKLLA